MDEPFSSSSDNFTDVTTFNSTVTLPTTLKSAIGKSASAELVATVGLIVCGVSICANSVVLAVLVRARKQFGSSVHTLIANQSAMDLFSSAFVIPLYIKLLIHGFSYSGNKILDHAICLVVETGVLSVVGLIADNMGLVVITLERYFKIVHAIAHRKYYRDWMTKVGVALPWITGASLILFPISLGVFCYTSLHRGFIYHTGYQILDEILSALGLMEENATAIAHRKYYRDWMTKADRWSVLDSVSINGYNKNRERTMLENACLAE